MEDKKSESVLEYRMEQVEKKLDQVEKKLDKVTDLLLLASFLFLSLKCILFL